MATVPHTKRRVVRPLAKPARNHAPTQNRAFAVAYAAHVLDIYDHTPAVRSVTQRKRNRASDLRTTNSVAGADGIDEYVLAHNIEVFLSAMDRGRKC